MSAANPGVVATPVSPAVLAGLATLPLQDTLAPAGQPGSTKTITVIGQSFYLYSSTGPLIIQPQGGDVNTYVQGTGLNTAPRTFNGLTVTNPGVTSVSFNLVVGFAEFIDKRLILVPGSSAAVGVQNSPTKLKANGFVNLNAGGFINYSGVAAGLGARKTFICQNLEPASGASLYLLDSLNVVMFQIPPGAIPIAVETSGYLSLFNPNAGAVGVQSGEIYYTF